MAYTAVTSFTNENICLDPAADTSECLTGHLTNAAYPGQFVYYVTATKDWDLLDTADTGANLIQTIGIVGYKKRVNTTTNALCIITTQYAQGEEVPIWISGVCVAYINDPTTLGLAGSSLIASSTAGSCNVLALAATFSTTSSTAVRAAIIGQLAITSANGDTKTIVSIGRAMGKRWTGYNF